MTLGKYEVEGIGRRGMMLLEYILCIGLVVGIILITLMAWELYQEYKQ